MKTALQQHPFDPLFDESSIILILGSFPSVKSRETGFYYGHPQNRFWRVMASLTSSPLPTTIEEKRKLMLKNHIALWDSISSCSIAGSSDSSIRSARPNDIGIILSSAPIKHIFCNGKASFNCYKRFIQPKTGIAAEALPSTSAANAAWSLEKLIEAWKVIMLSMNNSDLLITNA